MSSHYLSCFTFLLFLPIKQMYPKTHCKHLCIHNHNSTYQEYKTYQPCLDLAQEVRFPYSWSVTPKTPSPLITRCTIHRWENQLNTAYLSILYRVSTIASLSMCSTLFSAKKQRVRNWE